MRILSNSFVILLISLPLYFQCSKDTVVSEYGGDIENEVKDRSYLGQRSPGTIPKIFAPGIIPERSFGITFSPDGKECFFTKRMDNNTIMTTRDSSGVWPEPVIASFSGNYEDLEPHITPDGNRLYFGSLRPLSGVYPSIIQQWYLDKTETGWSPPQPMEPPLRGLFMFYPSVATNGNMYFTRNDGYNQWISMSRYTDGHYQEPERLSQNINSRPNAAHPFIAPDESYLIFDAFPVSGQYFCDLFISFRNQDGAWSLSINMGDRINTDANEICASVSPDGKYLFFTRTVSGGNSHIYWVDAKIIEDLKPDDLK